MHYLFGKPQDYGFAHTELVTVVQAKVTGEVSYHVDPNVDEERDFVRDTLNATGLVEHFGYVRFFAKGGRVRTHGGSNLQTDGRVLVMTLMRLPGP